MERKVTIAIGGRIRNLASEESDFVKMLLNRVHDPVVVTRELFPSLVLEARKGGVKAILILNGTSLSHAAILAKSFAIPVLKIENLYALGLKDKDEVLVDAERGRLVINPGKESMDRIGAGRERKEMPKLSSLPLKIWINIVDPAQLGGEEVDTIEGIGLYRTESLFMEKKEDFPDEDEQYRVYSSLFEKAGERPVTIRTLDIGGDKTLSYFSFGPQENPYLGFRAHRIYRFHPEIFVTQMRAILRSGAHSSNLRVLYPMIENVDEMLFVQSLLKKTMRSLKKDGFKYSRKFHQGVLVEVPSAVWDFKKLLGLADFASLGTNDLLQYFFAVDRNNANVSGSYGPENPTSLRMLKSLVETAKELDKPLNICGEIASDIRYLPLLVGLGIENISIDLHALPSIRKFLSSLDVTSCRQLAQECLGAEKISEVRIILNKFEHRATEQDIRSKVGQNESIDPICGMVVHTKGNKFRVDRDGKTVYFCSRQCMDKYSETGSR
jgi:phosphoenolpyruvate-protein phosphotransferase